MIPILETTYFFSHEGGNSPSTSEAVGMFEADTNGEPRGSQHFIHSEVDTKKLKGQNERYG